jgi:uncharacterized protein
MMEAIGYISAILIGISLGLIGAGGSILTLPVLVYLFHQNPVIATSYSLFIVGTTSLIGAANNFRKGLVDVPVAFFFGISSIATVYVIRKVVLPMIPSSWAFTKDVHVSFSVIMMFVFALLMLMASVSMITDRKSSIEKQHSRARLFFFGIGVGLITGFLGAGGGFLLIPALIRYVGLEMKRAIGTSLLIIMLNSFIGFAGDLGGLRIDWQLLLIITLLSITGVLIGSSIGKYFKGHQLKRGFGWFVLAIALFIIVKEVVALM